MLRDCRARAAIIGLFCAGVAGPWPAASRAQPSGMAVVPLQVDDQRPAAFGPRPADPRRIAPLPVAPSLTTAPGEVGYTAPLGEPTAPQVGPVAPAYIAPLRVMPNTPGQAVTGWPPASYDPNRVPMGSPLDYLTPAQRYYYPVQVPPVRPDSPPMVVPLSWACPTGVPETYYTVDRWRAYGGRWVDCRAAAYQTGGWGAAWPTGVAPAAPQPYRLAPGAEAIGIYYELERADGHLEVTGGAPADTQALAVELNGQAAGPATVLIEVFADFPGVGAVEIASFHSVPGSRGTYAVDAAGMERLARQFVRFVNNSDPNISASHPIPVVTLTLRVTGDDPNPASPAITLSQVATLTPHLRNVP